MYCQVLRRDRAFPAEGISRKFHGLVICRLGALAYEVMPARRVPNSTRNTVQQHTSTKQFCRTLLTNTMVNMQLQTMGKILYLYTVILGYVLLRARLVAMFCPDVEQFWHTEY